MGLEDLEGNKYIDSLVITNPDGDDGKNEGDNHIRGVKNTVTKSFPFIAGAVSASHGDLSACTNFEETLSATTLEVTLATGKTINLSDVSALKINGTVVDTTAAELNKLNGATATTPEINTLSGVTSAIQTQLDGKASSAAGVTNGNSHNHDGGDGSQIPTNGIANSAITNAKMGTDSVTATEIDWVLSTGSNWNISSGGVQVVPIGLAVFSATSAGGDASILIEVNQGGTWRTERAPTVGSSGGVVVSDGTNVRLYNNSGASAVVYYRFLV